MLRCGQVATLLQCVVGGCGSQVEYASAYPNCECKDDTGNYNINFIEFNGNSLSLSQECYSKLPLETRLEIVEDILKLCLKFGSHLDEVNASGQTIVDLAESAEMKALIRQFQSSGINLKCLASRVIVEKGIEYQEEVPYLIKYIQLHDRQKAL